MLFSAINRFSSSHLDPCLMMPAEKVGPLAGRQPWAISLVTQRDFISRWKIQEIFCVASPVVASGTAQHISFNGSALVWFGALADKLPWIRPGGGRVQSHRLFALPEISTPTAVLVETRAPSFSMPRLLSSLPSAALALPASAAGIPSSSRGGANKHWGDGS